MLFLNKKNIASALLVSMVMNSFMISNTVSNAQEVNPAPAAPESSEIQPDSIALANLPSSSPPKTVTNGVGTPLSPIPTTVDRTRKTSQESYDESVAYYTNLMRKVNQAISNMDLLISTPAGSNMNSPYIGDEIKKYKENKILIKETAKEAERALKIYAENKDEKGNYKEGNYSNIKPLREAFQKIRELGLSFLY